VPCELPAGYVSWGFHNPQGFKQQALKQAAEKILYSVGEYLVTRPYGSSYIWVLTHFLLESLWRCTSAMI
jgi:hypothetical protein